MFVQGDCHFIGSCHFGKAKEVGVPNERLKPPIDEGIVVEGVDVVVGFADKELEKLGTEGVVAAVDEELKKLVNEEVVEVADEELKKLGNEGVAGAVDEELENLRMREWLELQTKKQSQTSSMWKQ
ncbi:hypothetical protein M0R45_034880 [Rubus argutus]|uniref:Uncharacterized protein n=1 Tax=Rubus argutus TaxID=59490 RepID=A0AAW1VV62_RUBAR